MAIQELFVVTFGDIQDKKDSAVKPNSKQQTDFPVYNLHNGAVVFKLKGFNSGVGSNCLSVINDTGSPLSRGVLASTGKDGGAGLWTWQKEQQTQRMLFPTKVSAFEVSPCGRFVASGSIDGAVVLFDLKNGFVLREIEANALHYGPVTVVRWLKDSSAFLTGGTDGRVHVNLLTELLDISRSRSLEAKVIPFPSNCASTKYKPIKSWHEHRNTITDIWVGVGKLSQLRIITSSLDKSLKIFQPTFSVSLATIVLDSPIHCLQSNMLETQIYAGCDDGKLAAIDLYKFNSDSRGTGLPVQQIKTLQGRSRVAAEGCEFVKHVWSLNLASKVTSLALNFDGTRIICGMELGQVVICDARNGQILRKVAPPNTSNFETSNSRPVTNIATFIKPPEMGAHNTKVLPLAVAPFRSKSLLAQQTAAKPAEMPLKTSSTAIGATQSLGANSIGAASIDKFYSSVYLEPPFASVNYTAVDDLLLPDYSGVDLTSFSELYSNGVDSSSEADLWTKDSQFALFNSKTSGLNYSLPSNQSTAEQLALYQEELERYKQLSNKMYEASISLNFC